MLLIIGGGAVSEALAREAYNNGRMVRVIGHNTMTQTIYQIKRLVERYGDISDVAITSGYLNKKFIGDYKDIDIEQIIDANMTFPIKIINLLSVISMKSRVTVFSSSVTFDEKRSLYALYAASKLGLERFIQSSIQGDGPLRLRIVRPARINSKLRWDNYPKNEDTQRNLIEPEEIASAVFRFWKNDDVALDMFKDDIVLEIFKRKGSLVCMPTQLKIKSE